MPVLIGIYYCLQQSYEAEIFGTQLHIVGGNKEN